MMFTTTEATRSTMTHMAHHNAPHNPRRISPLGALKVLNQPQWEAEIRKAMEEADGRVPAAAEILGVSKRQMWRWLEDPCFNDLERAPMGNPDTIGERPAEAPAGASRRRRR